MKDECTALYAAFFAAEPDAFAGVRYAPSGPDGLPDLLMSADTAKRFVLWCDAQGFVGRREKLHDLLSLLTQMEQGAHRA